MQKISNIMLGVITALSSILLYFLGNKAGKQKVENEQLNKINETFNKELDNVKKFNKIETATKLANSNDVINGLREWTTKDDSN